MRNFQTSVGRFVASLVLTGCFVISAQAETAAGPIKLLAFGDSLTEGYGLADQNDGFTAELERALAEQGHRVDVINAGFAGDTTQGGLDRLSWSLFDEPDIAILQLGANDMLRGFDPAVTRKNLTELLDQFLAADVPVLLAGMQAAPSMGRGFAQEFNSIYTDLAAAYAPQGVLFYPFFLDGVAAEPQLNQSDGLHPNPAGVDVIVERILPSVEQLLDQINGG